MRTTLTLDDDLSLALKKLSRSTGQSFKEVVNSTLRRGLAVGKKPNPELPRFEVKPFEGGFLEGVDPYRLNQLNDELQVEEFLAKLRRDPS